MMRPSAVNYYSLMQPSQRILSRLRAAGINTSRAAAVRSGMERGLHLEVKRD